MVTGLLVLFIFIADIWAITTILGSSVTPGLKVLWCLLVFLLPVLGFILRFVAGPGDESIGNGIPKSTLEVPWRTRRPISQNSLNSTGDL